MSVSYKRLWKLLIDKDMNKSDLAKATKMSPNTVAKLGKNESVSLEILVRICNVLHCDIGDIVEIVPCGEENSEKTTGILLGDAN